MTKPKLPLGPQSAVSPTHSGQSYFIEENYLSTPLETIPKDIALPYPVYISVAKKMVLFRCKGDTLLRRRADKLLEKIDTLYIKTQDWVQFLSDLENIVEGIDLSKNPEAASQDIRNLLYAYGKHLEHSRELQKTFYEKVKLLSEKMAYCMSREPAIATKLIKRCSDPTVYISNHSVNVAIFSALVALKLGWDKDRISKLILAGFIHNIGLIKIPEEIVNKSAALTHEEWVSIKKHPELGAEILSTIGASADIVRACREHHEQPDGKGYPKGLKDQEIAEYVFFIGVADVYDALLSTRPWEQAYIPELAIEMMREMKGRFSQKIFQLVGKKT